jgi:sugar phosphate isomerase/epimerase
MVFVSSSCVKTTNIADSIRILAEAGFRNIELSGGTDHYDGILQDVTELKQQYGLNILCHNYFPPPPLHFTLNLASLHDDIYNASMDFVAEAIRFSAAVGADKYGFHAGYFIDPVPAELGKPISKSQVANREKAGERFCGAFNNLERIDPSVRLYIENNVISHANFQTYSGNPLMLTGYEEYVELQKKIRFRLLLDIAHLKVSCVTMGRDFEQELASLLRVSDYIHLSDNDGRADQNLGLSREQGITSMLGKYDLSGKTITLEVYEDIQKLKDSHQIIQSML